MRSFRPGTSAGRGAHRLIFELCTPAHGSKQTNEQMRLRLGYDHNFASAAAAATHCSTGTRPQGIRIRTCNGSAHDRARHPILFRQFPRWLRGTARAVPVTPPHCFCLLETQHFLMHPISRHFRARSCAPADVLRVHHALPFPHRVIRRAVLGIHTTPRHNRAGGQAASSRHAALVPPPRPVFPPVRKRGDLSRFQGRDWHAVAEQECGQAR